MNEGEGKLNSEKRDILISTKKKLEAACTPPSLVES